MPLHISTSPARQNKDRCVRDTLIRGSSINAFPCSAPFGRVTLIALDSQLADNRSTVSSGIGMPTIPNLTRRKTAIYPYEWTHANADFIISLYPSPYDWRATFMTLESPVSLGDFRTASTETLAV